MPADATRCRGPGSAQFAPVRAVALLMLAMLCSSCADRDTPQPLLVLGGSTMGTSFSIKVRPELPEAERESLRTEIEAVLDEVDRTMSTYRDDSELSRFNSNPGTDWIPASAVFCYAVDEAREIGGGTNGAFDMTVAPLVNLWGFGPDDVSPAPPDDTLIKETLATVGYVHVHTDCTLPAVRKDLPNVSVDLSGYAKGYAVDRVAALLDTRRLADYLVEIGGELRVRGLNASDKQWAVAIETPTRDKRSVHTVIRLTDSAVATSGDYRNYTEHEGKYYSHIIDPRTGYPVSHAGASVTVVAENAAYADAMATALLVLGPDDGLLLAERNELAALFLVRENGEVTERATSRFAEDISAH